MFVLLMLQLHVVNIKITIIPEKFICSNTDMDGVERMKGQGVILDGDFDNLFYKLEVLDDAPVTFATKDLSTRKLFHIFIVVLPLFTRNKVSYVPSVYYTVLYYK